jgi:hypothetical protein
LALSVLNGAAGAAQETFAELGGCRDCIARLAVRYLLMYATQIAHMAGGANEAAKLIEHGLVEDLDGQQG